MIVLDTNVVSELMRPESSPAVWSWMAKLATPSLHLTAITEAELRFGLAIMPAGRRRDSLDAALQRVMSAGFAQRVLPFDSAAARPYADIAAALRTAGRPIGQADCQIAAIAGSRGMAVATRNVRHFAGTGVRTIDPWTAD